MVRRMTVVDYSEQWPELAAREMERLRNGLGDVLVRAHHIGSTAVSGLAAKPIIDLLLEVVSLETLDARDGDMQSLGYVPRGEFGILGRRYYPKGGDQRTHHIHAFVVGDCHIARHLAFRDYLRAHPKAVESYAAVKMEAASEHATDPEGYVAYKQAYVEHEVKKAVHWAQRNHHLTQRQEGDL